MNIEGPQKKEREKNRERTEADILEEIAAREMEIENMERHIKDYRVSIRDGKGELRQLRRQLKSIRGSSIKEKGAKKLKEEGRRALDRLMGIKREKR